MWSGWSYIWPRTRLYLTSAEARAFLRFMRCILAQGLMQAALLAMVIYAVGYVAFKASVGCPKEQVCIEARNAK